MGVALCALAVGAVASAADAPDAVPPSDGARTGEEAQLLEAMELELARNAARLRLEHYEAPYFLAYTLRETESIRREARLGALSSRSDRTQRTLYVEVRVGEPGFDNTSVDDLDVGPRAMEDAFAFAEAPLDDDPLALRTHLWRLTDAAFKDALAELAAKKGKRVFEVDPQASVGDFAPRDPVRLERASAPLTLDVEAWEARMRDETAYLRQQPWLVDGTASLDARRVRRLMVQTGGTRIATEDVYVALFAAAEAVADDGMSVDSTRQFYVRAPADLPRPEAFHAAVVALADEVKRLREAPVLPPFTGPAILDASGTGVFFHEALGHRLEGERQRSQKSGQTFTTKVGERIVPEFLSVSDDPTLASYDGIDLWGHYAVDDEGTPAERARLVENGVLRGYLMSRTPLEGSPVSNGHGRGDGRRDPRGRMATLVVEASKAVSRAELKKRLLAEVRRRDKPFGLILEEVSSGETNTSRRSFQAFRATPQRVWRVDGETGEETLVRGVEVVGTPLAAISRILAAGDAVEVRNGYCGAESGYVPVSEVAPPTLVEELEVQRTTTPLRRPPILPSPVLDAEPVPDAPAAPAAARSPDAISSRAIPSDANSGASP